ncbi:MAG: hypothetical protein PVJ33_13250 [Lysobacterales bacterium]|jgi:hypothetical protein
MLSFLEAIPIDAALRPLKNGLNLAGQFHDDLLQVPQAPFGLQVNVFKCELRTGNSVSAGGGIQMQAQYEGMHIIQVWYTTSVTTRDQDFFDLLRCIDKLYFFRPDFEFRGGRYKNAWERDYRGSISSG